jgi:hypothetical protein
VLKVQPLLDQDDGDAVRLGAITGELSLNDLGLKQAVVLSRRINRAFDADPSRRRFRSR